MACKNEDRARPMTIAFRVTKEMNERLNLMVAMSGLTKQDYIIYRVLGREIIVQPNPRVYKALKDQLAMVLNELRKNDSTAENSDLLDTINLITATLGGIKGGEE